MSLLLNHVFTKYEAYLSCIASSKKGDKRQRMTIHHTVLMIITYQTSLEVKGEGHKVKKCKYPKFQPGFRKYGQKSMSQCQKTKIPFQAYKRKMLSKVTGVKVEGHNSRSQYQGHSC